MNKKFKYLSIVVAILMVGSIFVNGKQINGISSNDLYERDQNWFENNPDSLPIWLTQGELQRLDEIGEGFEGTSAPPSPVRMPAEFEPMQGVLIRYPFGISYQIIAEMSEDVDVVTIVASSSEQSYVYSQYQSHGVNMNNVDFLIAPSDSYWTRDYGPWFIFTSNDEQGITDFIYNRPRPNDNQIPSKFGIWQGIPIFGMNLEHTGGNYMTDGQGIAVSTDIVWSENPGYSHSQIAEKMEDYCGIKTYHVVPDPNGDYIKHVDCWAKYLAPDTILIREVPQSHSRYAAIEATVDYFEAQTSCYGTPYNIVRVYTPNNQPYTNSLILNDKVIVPITGSQWDDDAIESYELAMPGYEVLGFTGSWVSTDALHCRAKGIVDRYMLYIEHMPLSGNQTSHEGFEVQAMIYPYSGENVNTAEIFFRIDGGTWQNFNMEYMGSNMYRYIISPPLENEAFIEYYIHAEDETGRSEYHPYIGAPMAHSFNAIIENNPPEIIDISGPNSGIPGTEYEFCIQILDLDEDEFYIYWDWGDGDTTGWLGPYEYVEEICASHTWETKGTFTIKVKIKDILGSESPEVELEINMPRNKILKNPLFLLIQRFLSFLQKF
jgi:agmatine/peptidylarginine deiminase